MTAPPVTKERMWSQALLFCVPALPGALGADTSTCAHMQGQRSPSYFFALFLSSSFPQLPQGKELLQGLQLLLTCPWHVLPFPEIAPCPALHISPTPFLLYLQDQGPAGKAVYRARPVTDALNKLQTRPQNPLQQSLDQSFREEYRHSSRGASQLCPGERYWLSPTHESHSTGQLHCMEKATDLG